jgi:hypothetical protein
MGEVSGEQPAAPAERSRLETWVPLVTLVVSVATVIASVSLTIRQLEMSTAQFRDSARDSHYSQIVAGLGSSAAAVQTNSMRLLAEFVEDRHNYPSKKAQHVGALDAMQTLMAFIEDQSSVRGFTGLHDYQSPQPIVLSRAMFQLERLDNNPRLGSWAVDISRANLHGINLKGFAPSGNLVAESVDLRRAVLTGLDLAHVGGDLRYAYLTCATLTGARLGRADLTGADLSGADLRGADLSHVTGLTSAQVHGAWTGRRTRLPRGVEVADPLGWDQSTCHTVADYMTGMQAGWGYLDTHPCPIGIRAARALTFSPPYDGRRRELVGVCRIRAGLRYRDVWPQRIPAPNGASADHRSWRSPVPPADAGLP